MGNCCMKKPGPVGAGGPSEARRTSGPGRKAQEPTVQDANSLLRAVGTNVELEEALKLADGKLVVVDFYATWCGPCKQIAPILEAMAAEHPNVVFVKADVDKAEELADQFGVTSMPTFLFFKDGVKLKSLSGATPDAIRGIITENSK